MNDDDLTEEDDVTGQEEIYANSPQFTNLPKNEETDFAIVQLLEIIGYVFFVFFCGQPF